MRIKHFTHPAAIAAMAVLLAVPPAAAVTRITGTPGGTSSTARTAMRTPAGSLGTTRFAVVQGLIMSMLGGARSGRSGSWRLLLAAAERRGMGALRQRRPEGKRRLRLASWGRGPRHPERQRRSGLPSWGKGHDILRGGRGEDRVVGGTGSDRLYGGPKRDVLTSGNVGLIGDGANAGGDDLLIGGPGQDDFWIGDGRQFVMGEADNDWVAIYLDGGRADLIDCGPGDVDSVFRVDGSDPADTFVNCEVIDGARHALARRVV